MIRFLLLLLCVVLCCGAIFAAGLTSFSQTVTVNGKAYAVRGVRIDLRDPHLTLKLGLAGGCVGHTESLVGIAKRYHALAAINGSYFDAYSNATLRNPDMSLITQGRLTYKSDIGCMLGFEADNTPHLACLRHRLLGTVTSANGHTRSWFAYWVNRRPTSAECITIFTRQWGTSVAPMNGTAVVVTDDVVSAITTGAAAIPENGFVIHCCNSDSMLARFHVGDRVSFSPEVTCAGGEHDIDVWSQVQEAVGCGPVVLLDGIPVFNPASEGFCDPKVLQLAGARSAVGFSADRGTLVLITTRNARVRDLGGILKALGCAQGMNLDGGASSGLYYHGACLTTPGRLISNALVVVEK